MCLANATVPWIISLAIRLLGCKRPQIQQLDRAANVSLNSDIVASRTSF